MLSLRILIVQETNWVERNVIHQHHLAERLAQRGHSVEIVDYDILWPTKNPRTLWRSRQVFLEVQKVIRGVTLKVTRPFTIQLPLLCHASWAASSLLELRHIVHESRPDVVIGLALTNSFPMALFLKRTNIPYVHVVLEPYHTMMPERWIRPIARAVERVALRATDRVVVFTPQMREFAREMGVSEERIRLFKTGISLDIFRPGTDGSQSRACVGIGLQEWVLFFMGWLYDFSGLKEILLASVQDPGLLDGVRFLIVGDGDIYHELVQLVGVHGLGDRVILTGRRPYTEVPSLLAAADVCLLPSLSNNTTREIVPMKVYEYLAAGKPVVASRLPGLVAEFGEGNGILYADNPVEAIQAAKALKKAPAQVRRMSVAGRRFAEQNADWEKTTDVFEKLLIAESNRSPETSPCIALT